MNEEIKTIINQSAKDKEIETCSTKETQYETHCSINF